MPTSREPGEATAIPTLIVVGHAKADREGCVDDFDCRLLRRGRPPSRSKVQAWLLTVLQGMSLMPFLSVRLATAILFGPLDPELPGAGPQL